jgi:hypothetical protein
MVRLREFSRESPHALARACSCTTEHRSRRKGEFADE